MLLCRKGTFDAGHRVLGHQGKCQNLHGHTYNVEALFSYDQENKIGFKTDFSEIKRVFYGFIEEHLDHAFIVNQEDVDLIKFLEKDCSKYFYMNRTGNGANPTAENIAKELFFIGNSLMREYGLYVRRIKLHETPNCFVICDHLKTYEQESLMGSVLPEIVKDFIEKIKNV